MVALGVCVGAGPRIARAEAPKLVLMVVVDQLSAHQLERWGPLMTGGLARLMRQGAVYTQARFAYANTETAPGHATLATGAWPSAHGVVSNYWYDEGTGREVYCYEDPAHGRSPAQLGAVDEGPGRDPARRPAARSERVVRRAERPLRGRGVAGGPRARVVQGRGERAVGGVRARAALDPPARRPRLRRLRRPRRSPRGGGRPRAGPHLPEGGPRGHLAGRLAERLPGDAQGPRGALRARAGGHRARGAGSARGPGLARAGRHHHRLRGPLVGRLQPRASTCCSGSC